MQNKTLDPEALNLRRLQQWQRRKPLGWLPPPSAAAKLQTGQRPEEYSYTGMRRYIGERERDIHIYVYIYMYVLQLQVDIYLYICTNVPAYVEAVLRTSLRTHIIEKGSTHFFPFWQRYWQRGVRIHMLQLCVFVSPFLTVSCNAYP